MGAIPSEPRAYWSRNNDLQPINVFLVTEHPDNPGGFMRRLIAIAVVALTFVAACGDGGGFPTTPTTTVPGSTTSATGAGSTTTVATTTSATTATTTTDTSATTTTAGTTTVPPHTAADALAAFFAAAEALDVQIKQAAAKFNAGLDEAAVTLSVDAAAAVAALDAMPLRDLIPVGMQEDLETKVLAVFADLDSRISSLEGGRRNIVDQSNLAWAMDCLGNGSTSAGRFAADLAAAKSEATHYPLPLGFADSDQAGVMAVRIAAIHSMNWGCDSCGGLQYDAAFSVDWAGRTLLDGVGFDATFDGTAWQITIFAC
jgi:hypothetical protein